MGVFGFNNRSGDQELENQIAGNGLSVASQQLAKGQRQIQNQAYGLAASQRGGNPALAMRNAQNANAAAQSEYNVNAGLLRAQEQQNALRMKQEENARAGQFFGSLINAGGTGIATALGGPAAGALVGGILNGNPMQAAQGAAGMGGKGQNTNGMSGGATGAVNGALLKQSMGAPQVVESGTAGVPIQTLQRGNVDSIMNPTQAQAAPPLQVVADPNQGFRSYLQIQDDAAAQLAAQDAATARQPSPAQQVAATMPASLPPQNTAVYNAAGGMPERPGAPAVQVPAPAAQVASPAPQPGSVPFDSRMDLTALNNVPPAIGAGAYPSLQALREAAARGEPNATQILMQMSMAGGR